MSTVDKTILDNLQEDLRFYKDSLQEVVKEIINQKVSDYPIFIAHQHPVNVGQMILNRSDYQANWSISVSVLEEFVEKSLIQKHKQIAFQEAFKDPAKYFCIFLVNDSMANFVFIPVSAL